MKTFGMTSKFLAVGTASLWLIATPGLAQDEEIVAVPARPVIVAPERPTVAVPVRPVIELEAREVIVPGELRVVDPLPPAPPPRSWPTMEQCTSAFNEAIETAKAPKPAVSSGVRNKLMVEGLQGPIVRRRAIEAADKQYEACKRDVPIDVEADGTCSQAQGYYVPYYEGLERGEVPAPDRVPDLCVLGMQSLPQIVTPQKAFQIPPDGKIRVAFNGGSLGMRYSIMSVARDWERNTRDPVTGEPVIRFDFGEMNRFPMAFNEWSTSDTAYAADIRIGFDPADGYWALIGTDTTFPPMVRAWEPSMNLGGMDGSYQLPQNWKATIYHEFGHALGLEHEHQHPSSVCGNALRLEDDAGYQLRLDGDGVPILDGSGRRPGVVTLLENAPNFWSRENAVFNVAQLQADDERLTTPFDPQSIMKYEFAPDWYADGAPPECLPTGVKAATPSEADYAIIREMYQTVRAQYDEMNER